MDNKQYIVFSDGEIGYVKNICTCEKCKERGHAEIFINDLDGDYLTCLQANDQDIKTLIYFGDSLVEAVNSLVRIIDKSKEVKYLQNLVDFYSKEMVLQNANQS